ncbi:MAG: hypothetical protein ABI548_27855 [Polyangiaceae bacterium]
MSDRASKCAIVRGDVTASSEAYDLVGVVETALARALVLAAEARRWDVVVQIATELQGAAFDGSVRRSPGSSWDALAGPPEPLSRYCATSPSEVQIAGAE